MLKTTCLYQSLQVKFMVRAIFVVGVGGTGGLLAPKLAKILLGSDIKLWIIDGDIVEQKNVERQPYQQFNINENKAVALSRKIKSNYDITVYEYSNYLTGDEITKISFDENYSEVIIIGCVDNHSTRILLENQFDSLDNCIYIDSANDETTGSIFISKRQERVKSGVVRSDVFPEIKLINDHPTRTCEAEISRGNMQQMVTNDIMANSIAKIVFDWLIDDFKTGVITVNGFDRVFIAD